MRGLVVIALALGACSFTPGALTPDAAPDGPPPVTVGFARATTLADEASGTVPVRVVLSAPAEAAITVVYTVAGATASKGTDFSATDGTLTFAPGDVEEVIDVAVTADALDESDETLDIELQSASDGAVLGIAQHTMTIAANVLPRVSFTLVSSMESETMSPMIEVTLSASPALPVTVDLAIDASSTATSGGTDFDLSATQLMFAAGETSRTIDLSVNNDILDEDDEQAIINLENPVNALLAATDVSRTHLIQDNDAEPSVEFDLASSSIAEGGTMIDLAVSLSTASGRAVSVEFAVDAASTAADADYDVMTTTPLTFAAGTTTQNIRIVVVQDTIAETSETVIVNLGALTNASAGGRLAHTLTINDDDSTCLGEGAYVACFAPPSTNMLNVNGTLDTDTDSKCSATAPAGWTGQPDSCFVVANNITVNMALRVTGSRPLVLFAPTSLTVNANINAQSIGGGSMGPGANSDLCATANDTPTAAANSNGAGGGAGGSFRTRGGDGGNGGVNTNNSGGTATAAVGEPAVLRGGCSGQTGGAGTNGNGAGGAGAGGGAVYLVTGGTLEIDSGIHINVSGAGGVAAGTRGGGGGGGSGGMIKLHAASFTITGARLVANGGGGSKGGDDNDGGDDGEDPDPTTPTTAAAGGTAGNGGGNGGDGRAGTTVASDGAGGSSSNAGGGGGGGGGHVEGNMSLTGAGATVSGP